MVASVVVRAAGVIAKGSGVPLWQRRSARATVGVDGVTPSSAKRGLREAINLLSRDFYNALQLRSELVRLVLAPDHPELAPFGAHRKEHIDTDVEAVRRIERMPPKGSALEALAAEWNVSPTLPDWLTYPHCEWPLSQLYLLCAGLARRTPSFFRQYRAAPYPVGTLNFYALRERAMEGGSRLTKEDLLSLLVFYVDPLAVRCLVWGVPGYAITGSHTQCPHSPLYSCPLPTVICASLCVVCRCDTLLPISPGDLVSIVEVALPNLERLVFCETGIFVRPNPNPNPTLPDHPPDDQMPGTRFCALMPGLAAACPKLHTVNLETTAVFEWPATTEIEGALAEAAVAALGDRLLALSVMGSTEGTTYDDALRALARCCPNLRELTLCGGGGFAPTGRERGGVTVPALLGLAAACPRLTLLDARETPGENLAGAYLADALTAQHLDQLGRCLPHLVLLRLPWHYSDSHRGINFRQPARPAERLKGLEALVRRCPNLAVLEIGYNADAENEALQRHLREVKRSAALARRRFRGVAGSVMGMRRAFGRAVERLFAPGGAGYEDARLEFTGLATTSRREASADKNDGASGLSR